MQRPPAAGTRWAWFVHASLIQAVPNTARTFSGGLQNGDTALPITRWAVARAFTQTHSGAPAAGTLLGSIMTHRVVNHIYLKFL
ncbi:MAG TPA: hypothetical protein VGQ39_18395 [Pyrinomonadaceae bacterium]|nr:hypothetical protein [Pyrinomonadaceae bacterium]